MVGIFVAPAGVAIFILGLVGLVIDPEYGIVGNTIGYIGLMVVGIIVAVLGFFLLWTGQRLEREKQNKKSYDRVEPPATKTKHGKEVDTTWTTLTKARTEWSEGHH